MSVSVVWLRSDLRLDDQPALEAGLRRGSILPVFIWDNTKDDSPGSLGEPSRWWLHRCLERLSSSLKNIGLPLILRKGDPVLVLPQIASEVKAGAVLWTRGYEPWAIAEDKGIVERLRSQGCTAEIFPGNYLFDLEAINLGRERPYLVFTPFWKRCMSMPGVAEPRPFPGVRAVCPRRIRSDKLEDWGLLPTKAWVRGLEKEWDPGEAGAKKRLAQFLKKDLKFYASAREVPSVDGTSRLSAHLHFGELSVRRLWYSVQAHRYRPSSSAEPTGESAFLRELGFREFSRHLLHYFPETATRPLRKEFEGFPWKKNELLLRAWKKGQTGYPLVDAGMRQLWRTGWMHNRVRMIVSSFLVKDLFVPWQEGAAWFRQTLVDADAANNTFGWQWSAGCGADAAPFFRIFNPVTQSEKFDADGEYIRTWVPELRKLGLPWIHRPWEAPPDILRSADIRIGSSYPRPVVDHAAQREKALLVYTSGVLRAKKKDTT